MRQLLTDLRIGFNLFLAQDKSMTIPVFVSLASIILILTAWLLVYPNLPPRLPLLYSHPWGETQLVPKVQFLIIPGVILLITALNCAITWQLHSSQVVLKRSLMLSLVLINGILVIAALKIIGVFI